MTGLLRRDRDFRLLWTGEVAGQFGSCVTGVAMPLIALTVLHADALTVSLITAAAWLPWLLVGLPAGAWVDRLPHRPVMAVAQAVALLTVASVPAAAWAGVLSIGQLLGVALVRGTAQVFFQTAYTAYLPVLLPSQDRAEGNAKLQGSASAAQLVGLSSGGALAQLLGVTGGMLVNAGTFMVSLLCLGSIRHRPAAPAAPAPAPAKERRPLRRDIAEGLRLVAGDPWIRSFTLFGAASNLALTGFQSIQVVFLIQHVGVSATAVGLLIAASGLGGVLGAFAGPRIGARIGTARAMLVLELGLPALVLLIPLTTAGAGLGLYLAGSLCVSLGIVGGNVLKAGFQQRYCPTGLLGRVTATASVLNFGAIPLGAVLAGALAGWVGLVPAMWIMTAGVPLAALLLLASPLPRHRDFPTDACLAAPADSADPTTTDSAPEAPEAVEAADGDRPRPWARHCPGTGPVTGRQPRGGTSGETPNGTSPTARPTRFP
ncbi:MFS transporter [Streptacidiphilus fuscans]|uniref:MFS transporter n=1 Tax=Streptacidiphilus fuscans TaxID=2789292 RepID=A0A931BBC4_9ACTN|nr:MFS transporter [Streptacidiphilus fuscans]MBF9070290.1 MFS transporter [Streptacidiphilus fuscans]